MIESAVDDLVRYRSDASRYGLCLWGHALVWVAYPDEAEDGALSLSDCCAALGIDVQWLSESLLGAYGRRPIRDRPGVVTACFNARPLTYVAHEVGAQVELPTCPIVHAGGRLSPALRRRIDDAERNNHLRQLAPNRGLVAALEVYA